MKRIFHRFIACTLALVTLGIDPAWATPLDSKSRFVLPLQEFLTEALETRSLAPGNALAATPHQNFKGPFWKRTSESPVETTGSSRRDWLKSILGTSVLSAVSLIASPTVTFAQQPSHPTLNDARSHRHLMHRLVYSSKFTTTSLWDIKAARDRIEVAMANNVWLDTNQTDLTHSPRLSLTLWGSFLSQWRTYLTDAIAKRTLVVEGPRSRVETLHEHQDGFWSNLADWIKTLAVKGGRRTNSDSIVLESLQDSYKASVDELVVERDIFKSLEQELWGKDGVESLWFELASLDIEIRQLQFNIRWNEKERGRLEYNKRRAADAVRKSGYVSKSGDLSTAEIQYNTQIVPIQAALQKDRARINDLIGQQQKLAVQLVNNHLKGEESFSAEDEKNFRPLLSRHSVPTSALIQQALLSAPHPTLVTSQLTAFAVDPYSIEGRSEFLDKAWTIPGWTGPSLLSRNGFRDEENPVALSDMNELANRNSDHLKLQVKASPEADRQGSNIQRYMADIDTFRIQELARWQREVFIKLGIDFPVEMQNTHRQPVRVDRLEKQIVMSQDIIARAQSAIDLARDQNETDVLNAQTDLQTARTNLISASQESVRLLGQLSNKTNLPQVKDLARDFENQLFDIEKRAMAMEQAYARLQYLLDGRRELKRLFEERRDAFLANHPSPEIQTPKTPERKSPKKRKQGPLARATWLGLLGTIVLSAAESAHPLLPLTRIGATTAGEWAFVFGMILYAIWWPHLANLKPNKPSLRLFIGWGFIAMGIMIVSPLGWISGVLIAAIALFLGRLFWPKTRTTSRAFGPAHGAATLLRRTMIQRLGIIGITLAILGFLLKPALLGINHLIDRGIQLLRAQNPGQTSVSSSPLRFPFPYMPPIDGELIAVNMPADGILSPERFDYLVRWIRAGDPIPSRTVFVFRMDPRTETPQRQATGARAQIEAARARLRTAQESGDISAIQNAQTDLQMAEAGLAAAQSKFATLDEPLPKNGPLIELDASWPHARRTQPVTAGTAIQLGVQQSSRAGVFHLILSPEEGKTLGMAMTHPERRIRMVFTTTPNDSISIPVLAIRQLRTPKEAGSTLPAILRDLAKGAYKQAFWDAYVLIDQHMIDAGMVSSETLSFLQTLNRSQAAGRTNLQPHGFEAWDPNTKKFEPIALEKMADNEVLAEAQFDMTPAPAARTTATQQTVVVDQGAMQTDIRSHQEAIQNLRGEISKLGSGDPTSAIDRNNYENQIREHEQAIHGLQMHGTDVTASVVQRSEQGTPIGPREVQKRVGDTLIIARDPIRALNPWTNLHAAANLRPENNEDIFDLNPQALMQLGANPTLKIRSALSSSVDANTTEWTVQFPGQEKSVTLNHTFKVSILDNTLDLLKVAIPYTLPLDQAERLMPAPGGILPVTLKLPSKPDQHSAHGLNLDTLFGIGTSVVLVLSGVWLVWGLVKRFRYEWNLRERQKAMPASPAHAVPSDKQSGYTLRGPQRTSPPMPTMRDATERLKDSFMPYERENAAGDAESIEVLMNRIHGSNVLTNYEAFKLIVYYKFLRIKDRLNQKTTQAKWIFIGLSLFSAAYLYSDQAFQILKTALSIGNAPWVYIGSQLSEIAQKSPFSWSWILELFLRNPEHIFALSLVGITLLLFVVVIFYNFWKMFGEWVVPGIATAIDYFFFKKFWKIDALKRKFVEESAKADPAGLGYRPDHAIRLLLNDVDDPESRLTMVEPGRFRQDLRDFGRMLADRASQTLFRSAMPYLHEDPLQMFANHQPFLTDHRRDASDARWFAATFYRTAQTQNTADALIPKAFDEKDLDINPIALNDRTLEETAVDLLQMDMGAIQRTVSRLVRPSEVAHTVQQIRSEYLQRARVVWALNEMTRRPISTLFTMAAYNQYGLALDPDQVSEDPELIHASLDIRNFLDAFHARLPTLAPRAHKLRQKYVRESKVNQLYYYLAKAFGRNPTDRLGDAAQVALRHRFVDAGLLRQRINRLPSFEALGFNYALTGLWDRNPEIQRDLEEFRKFYREQLHYPPYLVDQSIDRIRRIITDEGRETLPTSLYMASLVARRLAKNQRVHFDNEWDELISKDNRTADDLRFLKFSASVMNAQKRNELTVADLWITDLEHGSLLETISRLSSHPPMGDIDIYSDLALANTLQDESVSLGEDAALIAGKAVHMAMSDVIDASARETDYRIETRLGDHVDAHALTSHQTQELLPHAAQKREGSVLITSVEPGNFTTATRKADPALRVAAPSNPHFRSSVQLTIIEEDILDAEVFFEKNPRGLSPELAQRRAEVLALGREYQRRDPRKARQYRRRLEAIHSWFSSLAPSVQQRTLVALRTVQNDMTAMGVGTHVYRHWDPGITHLVPSPDDDRSYTDNIILFPYARPYSTSINFPEDISPDDTALFERDHLTNGSATLMLETEWGNTGNLKLKKKPTGANYKIKEIEDGVAVTEHDNGHFELRIGGEDGQVVAHRSWHRQTLQLHDPVTDQDHTLEGIYHTDTTVVGSLKGSKLGKKIGLEPLAIFHDMLGDKGIVYCNVDANNIPSLENITRLEDPKTGYHYKKVGEFVSGFVGHWNPKKPKAGQFRPARPQDMARIHDLLQTTYRDHQFTDYGNSGSDLEWLNTYYVWEENGQVIAAVSAKKMDWEFTRLISDYDSSIVIPLFRVLPYFRRVFNLGDLHFLKIGNMAFAPGREKTARELIEATMAEKEVHAAWGFFDPQSPPYKKLKKVNTFGPLGFLDMLQETKMVTLAIGMNAKSQELVDHLHENLTAPSTEPTAAAKRRPQYVPNYNLSWWLTPFILLGTLIGIHPSAEAAVIPPTDMGQAAHVAQQAVQQATDTVIPYVVQNGDSWWKIAEKVLGHGDQFKDLIAQNADFIHQVPLNNPYLIHAGDKINIGLVAHAPSAPIVHMVESPIGTVGQWFMDVDQWIHHLNPDLLWISGLFVVGGLFFWLWKDGTLRRLWMNLTRPMKRPIPILAMLMMTLGGALFPSVFNPPAPKKSEIVFNFHEEKPQSDRVQAPLSRTFSSKDLPVISLLAQTVTPSPAQDATDSSAIAPVINHGPSAPLLLPTWTIEPASQIVEMPADVELWQHVRAPTAPSSANPKEPMAQYWLNEANQRLREAQEAWKLNRPWEATQSVIDQRDLTVIAQLRALFGDWKKAPTTAGISATDLAKAKLFETQLNAWEKAVQERLAHGSQPRPDISMDPAVLQLRKEWAAHYNQRIAQSLTTTPLALSSTAKPTASNPIKRLWNRLKPKMKSAEQISVSLLEKGSAHTDAIDPIRDSIQERLISLIQDVKRQAQTTHEGWGLAYQQSLKARQQWQSSTGPDQILAQIAYIQALRQQDAYQVAAQNAWARMTAVRDALITRDGTENVGMPIMSEKDHFEVVFQINDLWQKTEGTRDTLAEKIAAHETEAAQRLRPVIGTEHMPYEKKVDYLDHQKTMAQESALGVSIESSEAQASMERSLALSEKLHELGMDQEAQDVKRQAQNVAKTWGLVMPPDTQHSVFRETAYSIEWTESTNFQNADPANFNRMDQLMRQAQEAKDRFAQTAGHAMQLERHYYWMQQMAKAQQLDPAKVLHSERAMLLGALQKETDDRVLLKAAELAAQAISGKASSAPSLFTFTPLELGHVNDPDAKTLARLEKIIEDHVTSPLAQIDLPTPASIEAGDSDSTGGSLSGSSIETASVLLEAPNLPSIAETVVPNQTDRPVISESRTPSAPVVRQPDIPRPLAQSQLAPSIPIKILPAPSQPMPIQTKSSPQPKVVDQSVWTRGSFWQLMGSLGIFGMVAFITRRLRVENVRLLSRAA